MNIPVILFNGSNEEKRPCRACGGRDTAERRQCLQCGGKGYEVIVTEPESKEVMLRLNPQCIESFYPCFYEGASMIVMMSGKEYMTPASCEAIERNIAGYWKHVNDRVNAQRPDPVRIVSLTPTP